MAQEHISGVLFPQAEEEKRRKKEEAARKKQEQEVTISLVYLVQGHREKNHTLSPATQFSVPSLGLDQVSFGVELAFASIPRWCPGLCKGQVVLSGPPAPQSCHLRIPVTPPGLWNGCLGGLSLPAFVFHPSFSAGFMLNLRAWKACGRGDRVGVWWVGGLCAAFVCVCVVCSRQQSWPR